MLILNLEFLIRALLLELAVPALVAGAMYLNHFRYRDFPAPGIVVAGEKDSRIFKFGLFIGVILAHIALVLAVITLAAIFAVLVERFGVEVLSADPNALFALAVVSIFLLFLLRCRNAIAYGLLEIAVGLVSVFISANAGQNISQATAIYELATRALGLLGGVYIVIRGLDNLDKNIPDQWRRLWDEVFRGKR
jgi:MFS superfamily sulfate permease-like transporter